MSKARSNELVEALSALIEQQPFFAVLLLDLLEVVETETLPSGRPLPTACTDGARIMVNPAFFKTLSVQERIFVLAHEVTHVILQHPPRMRLYHDLGYGPDLKPFSNGRFNKAADYVINSYLTELKVGKQPLNSLSNPHITSADLVDEVYLKVPDDPDKPDGGGWDTHEPQATDADAPEKGTIQRAVKSAANAQKSMGKLPGGLQRLIDEICEPQVTWTDHLRRTITTAHGTDQQTWCRPNRRKLAVAPHIYWPGRNGTATGEIAVEVDCSGSIGEADLKVFMGEVHGVLMDCRPQKIHLGYVDTELFNDEIHEITDPNDLLEVAQKAGGGGGTNLPIFFQILKDRGIEVEYRIVLTDGYTPFDEDDGIPTIWCITSDIVAPWGETVHVKL